METIWFWLLAFMGGTYVVLGGSDLGVGIANPIVAKSEEERWQVIRAIRPVWKPNEVWLVAAGGTLFLAFPKLFAVALSGFYLPMMLVLWLLAGRGLGIELRYQLPDRMWTQFWDFVIATTSLLLAICFGAALGNLVRGVPLDSEGQFFQPLWTDFRVGSHTGILDWYTVLVGITATVALMHHGALWLAVSTDGAVKLRSERLATRLWVVLLPLLLVVDAVTFAVRPELRQSVVLRPFGALFPLLAIAGLVAVFALRRRGSARGAVLASAVALYGMVGTAAIGIYPEVLPARDPALGLTVHQAAAPREGLLLALFWWIPGMALVGGYYAYLAWKIPRPVSLRLD